MDSSATQVSRRSSPRPFSDLVHDFPWVHRVLGLLGNAAFVAGSVLFFSEAWKTVGIWLFVIGSSLMLVGSAGEFLVRRAERGRS